MRKVFQMTREATKKKRDKKRAQKKKHEHQTEHMAEEAAKEKRLHTEEIIAIVVLLMFVPFMVTGIMNRHPDFGTNLRNGPDRDKYAEFYEQMLEAVDP